MTHGESRYWSGNVIQIGEKLGISPTYFFTVHLPQVHQRKPCYDFKFSYNFLSDRTSSSFQRYRSSGLGFLKCYICQWNVSELLQHWEPGAG